MKKENFNRRDFIKTSFKTIAIGTLALSAIDIKKLTAQADEDNSAGAAKVINVADYPDLGNVGGHAIIGKTLFVSRTGKSSFIALSTLCTHKKCEVDYTGSGFECPCHGSTYSSTGKVLEGPAQKSLKSYKTSYNEADNTLTINM